MNNKNIAFLLIGEHEVERTATLAKELAIDIVSADSVNQYDFVLFYDQQTLKLKSLSNLQSGAVWVDFCSGKSAYRQKHQGKGKLPLSRACGIKQSHRPSIIDATAGLGQDAFVLAGLGCEVLCIEQQPFLAALLEDGLNRALNSDSWIRDIVQRMQLKKGQSEQILESEKADIVYLDPMYPHQQNRKLAKVKKAMQLFREFPGTESDEPALLASALGAALDRVVVKRPDWASPLGETKPSYSVPSKTHRFDVYKIEST